MWRWAGGGHDEYSRARNRVSKYLFRVVGWVEEGGEDVVDANQMMGSVKKRAGISRRRFALNFS